MTPSTTITAMICLTLIALELLVLIGKDRNNDKK